MTVLRLVQVFFMYFKQNELLTVCLKRHQMAPRKPRRQNINVKKIYIKRSVFKLLIKNNHIIILMDIATEIR